MSCTRTRGKKATHIQTHEIRREDGPGAARGHGNYETDRPPIFSVKGRESGEIRYCVEHRSDTETCLRVIRAAVGEKVEILNTDKWKGYARVEVEIGIAHAAVRHGQAGKDEREWARDDDGDGIREVHCRRVRGSREQGCEPFCECFEEYIRNTWRSM